MDKDQQIKLIQSAIDEADNWATKGWPCKFGIHQTPISSLGEAQDAKESVHNRQEALAFWVMIDRTGKEAVECGRKAVEALNAGDMRIARGQVFFAMHKERMLLERTTTWGPVFKAM